MNTVLPRELWQQIMLFCTVPDIVTLRRVCHSFHNLSDPSTNASLWRKKASEERLSYAADPTSSHMASALDVRLLPGEDYYDVVRTIYSWKNRTRISQISRAQTTTQIDHSIHTLQSLTNNAHRRFLVAEPISHKFLIRWSSSGPLVFQNKDELRVFNLTRGSEVQIDEKLRSMRFIYAVPHSNWVVFKDAFGEYQLGAFKTDNTGLQFVESADFAELVADTYASFGNGQIIPIRGYGDIIVVGIKSPPTGNLADASIRLAAIDLNLIRHDTNELSVKAAVRWTKTVQHATSLFVDNHDGFLIFVFNDGFFNFKVIGIRCGTLVVGHPSMQYYDEYQEVCRADFITCSRFHLVAKFGETLKVYDHGGTSMVAKIDMTSSQSPSRVVISDDGSLILGIETKTNIVGKVLEYSFSVRATDISLGTSEYHSFSQTSDSMLITSGLFVIYEELKHGVWERHRKFLVI
ncbi:hypothetical protein HDU99_004120 [Rhizoclosmatium hyalinum]|nr:hypothetical protein HDU99_004120 [Rhizoclosmatium hyalinum]